MVSNQSELDRIFGALADEKRRAILERLTEGDATVGELAEPFRVSRQAIGKHLRVLEEAGLVSRDRDGRMTRCRLDTEAMEDAYRWLDRYRIFWSGRLAALARFVEGRSGPHQDPDPETRPDPRPDPRTDPRDPHDRDEEEQR